MTNVYALWFFCVHIFVFLLRPIQSAAVLTPFNCQKGCRRDNQCPKNGHCASITTTCGICLCNDGFTTMGNRCKNSSPKPAWKSIEKPKSLSRTQFPNYQTTTARNEYPLTPVPKSAALVPSLGLHRPPPTPELIECSQYECGSELESGRDAEPLKIRSQKLRPSPLGCKNKFIVEKVVCNSPLFDGPADCVGVHCLDVTRDKSFCICPYNKVGDGCHENKPGKCSSATGEVPDNGYISTDKRFYHNERPDQGDIIARHFALNLEQCIKLCQWTKGLCRSVNYGPISGHNVCELLSVKVNKGTILDRWIKTEPGWTYACCFSK